MISGGEHGTDMDVKVVDDNTIVVRAINNGPKELETLSQERFRKFLNVAQKLRKKPK